MRQINFNENENGRILDRCFVSALERPPTIAVAPAPLVKFVPHHPPLLLSLESNADSIFVNDIEPVRFNFDLADYESISAVLSSINWDATLDNVLTHP